MCSSCDKRGAAISTGIDALRQGQLSTAKRAAIYVAASAARDTQRAAQSAAQSLNRLRAAMTRPR